MRSWKTYGCLILGTISLGLGVIGIFLPILPTTPFLLLAAFCYLRSSKRRYEWLIQHPVLGPYVKDYLVHKAIKRKTKIIAITMIWLSLSYCIWIVSGYLKFMLFAIGLAVTIYLLRLKTLESM